MDNPNNLPTPYLDPTVDIPQPTDAEEGDNELTLARKQLGFVNGLLKACHMSLGQVTSIRGLGNVIDNSLKVMKAQRELLGHGPSSKNPTIIVTLPD